MKLENGFSDLKISDAALSNIQDLLHCRFEDDETDNIELTLNLISDDTPKESGDSFGWDVVTGFKLAMKYPHPDKVHNDREFSFLYGGAEEHYTHLVTNILEQVELLIEQRDMQYSCSHQYEAPKDPFGSTFEDGRGVCTHCGLSSSSALPASENQSPIVSASLSRIKEYVAQNSWPTGTKLQAGDSGIVISKNGNYETAFFEAFPIVGEHSTFIRGEGENFLSAEAECFKKYQRMVACDSHEFSREVNGTHRDDGCGQCIKCGLFSSRALPPLTLCSVCAEPTKRQHGTGFLCNEHYFELKVEDVVANRIEFSYRDQSEKEKLKSQLSSAFVFSIKKGYFQEYGNDLYNEYSSYISSIAYRVLMLVNNSVFDIHPFRSKEGVVYPTIDNPVYQAVISALVKELVVLSDEEQEGFSLSWLESLCHKLKSKQGSE